MAGFNDIVGQDHLKEQLKKSLQEGNISHAYLLNGELRSGKEYIAKIFAAALQCNHETDKPCQNCPSCAKAFSGNHPDIIFVTHEKPNTIGVEDIRNKINNDIGIKPYHGPYKIYIMNEAEKMTVQAQNALLKTLEEPPAYAVIILLTCSMEALLPTIISRCVNMSMKPVPNAALKNFLMKEMRVPDYKADIAVAFARGNLGRAKIMVANEDFDKMRDDAVSLMKYIDEMEISEIMEDIRKIKDYKYDVEDYLDIIMVWYRDVLLFKATNDVNGLIFKNEIQYIKRVAQKYSYEGIENIVEALEKAKARLKANVNYDMTMELLLLTIQEQLH
ncbi:MAG: DNA polymerase III subunit delta' [Lachnospiraceae bacterium]|nr:DNA polymerase III subunit delta' [Lachnospiraceae bacterium]MBQ7833765.1 DNA polymerase III subunit delta' [Lachnospiraceae bacterium]